MSTALVADWHAAHTRILDLLRAFSDNELRTQYHPDLSPLGWHGAHVAVVEAFWLREVVADEPLPTEWKQRYFPELAAKAERGAQLPPKDALLHLIDEVQSAQCAQVAAYLQRAPAHPLWQRHYLLHFLLQHRAQHEEIQQQILTQRQLQLARAYEVGAPLRAATATVDWVEVAGGDTLIGDAGNAFAYDNELPAHRVSIDAFAIAAVPVTNAQYLGFMQAGGYADAAFWTHDAWLWRGLHAISHPSGWRRDAHGEWYRVTADGPRALIADEPVVGLSHYEARAYARYAQARLPHEAEWEHAYNGSAISPNSVGAWEWCANTFYPYPGFRAFPYDGYSTPWFDGRHYTLRGGSRYTAACLRRATFRNFYTPEKRHVFAGLRLARA